MIKTGGDLTPQSPSQTAKPFACLSLDLDNKWSYMKTHGDPGWAGFPSYLELLIPRVLEILERCNLKITFFIVGQDAALEKNRRAIAEITRQGHDVGNHSFNHEPWLPAYHAEKIKKEIIDTEQVILDVTGQKPLGFRGPGFCWSQDLLSLLAEFNYLYDASTLPTYLGPLGRLYYFAKSGLSAGEKKQRKDLFGSFWDGLRPVKPYLWLLPSRKRLLEIPVTTMPAFKVPFHLSYLVYLSLYSPLLMVNYLNMAIRLCRLFQTGLSFLLHPLDFLDRKEFPELAFFPGMAVEKKRKLNLFEGVLQRITRSFQLVDMKTYAKVLLNQSQKLCLYRPFKKPTSLEFARGLP